MSELASKKNFSNSILSSIANAILHFILNNSRNSFQIWQRSSHAICNGNFRRSVMKVDSFMSDTGVVLKKFRGISFNISTNCSYHWITNDCDKQIHHCSYTFSSIWPSWFCIVKHTDDSCNVVDHLVQWCGFLRNVRWTGNESQSRFLAFLCKFRPFTL